MRLEIEETALKKEKDKASVERLERCAKSSPIEGRSGAMRSKWEEEKKAIAAIRQIREKIEEARREMEKAERAYDLNRAAELRHGKLPELEANLHEEEAKLAEKQKGPHFFARKSPKKRLPKWWHVGREFPCHDSWNRSARNF